MTLSEIPALDSVRYDPAGGLSIGAMATLTQVIESNDVEERYRALWESAVNTGTPQIRNVATTVDRLALTVQPQGGRAS